LIQPPKSFYIVGVEFEQLLDEPWGDLLRCQMHLVQSAKKRQQIEPGRFQAGAQIDGKFHLGSAEHSLSMAHLRPAGQRGRSPSSPSHEISGRN